MVGLPICWNSPNFRWFLNVTVGECHDMFPQSVWFQSTGDIWQKMNSEVWGLNMGLVTLSQKAWWNQLVLWIGIPGWRQQLDNVSQWFQWCPMKVNLYPSWDLFLASCGITINGCLFGGILSMENHQNHGFQMVSILKWSFMTWMIWGYPHYRKPPFGYPLVNKHSYWTWP